jgi:hypothetical protein
MTASFKPKQVRMNLNEECQIMFSRLCESASDLPESQLATLLITSALRAVRDQGYKVTVPLKMHVDDSNPSN